MIENENYIEFVPQLRMYENSFSQKDLRDSDYVIPDFQEFNDGNSPYKKQKQSFKTQNPLNNAKNQQLRSSNQRFSIKKIFFSQGFIKMAAQKFKNLSQILQNEFKNNDLMVEQYVTAQLYNIDQNLPQYTGYLPVLQLNNFILKFWQIIKLVVCLFLMWWMPFKQAFIINKNVDTQDYILLIIIFFDILIQINKEIILQGQLIKDRKIIIDYYIRNHIAFDIIYLLVFCCIIFQLISKQISEVLEILFFFFNLNKFQNVIKNYQESTVSTNEKIYLFELILTVLILAHFMACIWFSVGMSSLNYYEDSWIIKLNILDQQLFTQYCYSFYWAATTMATVGYGDITGQNLHEIICSSILIFFSSGIFAFTINSIGVILNNINQNQSIYKRSLLLINQHMDNNEVSSNLQNKIRNYLKFYYQSSHSSHEKDVDIVVGQLSQNLKEELINDIRSKVVMNNIFLQKYFSKQTQQILIQNLQHINFTPQEQIYEQSTNDDHSFYIIQKGQVNIVDKASRRIIYQFKQGDCFGEIEFLTELPRYSSAYSVGFTKLLKISRSNFISIIKQDQTDFEQFHMLKDQIKFKIQSPSQCKVCLKSHLIYDCNKLFYKPNIEKVIKKDLFHCNQERHLHQRKIEKSIFPLANIEYIQQRCENFRYDNNIEDEQNETNSKSSLIKSKQQIQSQSQFQHFQQEDQYDQSLLTKNYEQQFLKPFDNDQDIKVNIGEKITQTLRLSTQSQRKLSLNYKQQQNQILSLKQLPYQLSKISSGQFKSEDQFIQLHIDKLKIYKTFSFNNHQNIILQYDKYQKKMQKEKYYTIPSNYRFFQIEKQKKKYFSSRNRLN